MIPVSIGKVGRVARKTNVCRISKHAAVFQLEMDVRNKGRLPMAERRISDITDSVSPADVDTRRNSRPDTIQVAIDTEFPIGMRDDYSVSEIIVVIPSER
jgi:hypothetical protein